MNAKKCITCDKMYEKEEGLRFHVRNDHKLPFSRKDAQKMDAVPCQSLSRQRNAKKLFRVSANDEDDGNELGRALLAYNPRQASSADNIRDERERSGFVIVTNMPERLNRLGMTMEEAFNLARFPRRGVVVVQNVDVVDEKRARFMTKALMEYLDSARDEFHDADSLPSILDFIGTPGSVSDRPRRPFKFLSADARGLRSQASYASRTCVLLLIVCRVVRRMLDFPKVVISERLRCLVDEVLDLDVDEVHPKDGVVQKLLHNLLHAVLFERRQTEQGKCEYFLSLVVPCLGVGEDELGTKYFRLGREVSPYMSGIMYTTSCCALLHYRRFCGGGVDGRNAAKAEIGEALQVGSEFGLTVLVGIRSKCATTRTEEELFHQFLPCTTHEQCGIYDGEEYSLGKLALALRSMHEALQRFIFEDLLHGKGVPPDFAEDSKKLVDDVSNLGVGYWAISDRRNKPILDRCIQAVRDEVSWRIDERVGGSKQWCSTVENSAVPLLATIVHIVSGAPGRGTEIGVMHLRNTRVCQRAVFFEGEEVMLIPSHNKTRSTQRGYMPFISRHLDPKTSFLLKSFFLLVYPLYVICKNRELQRANGQGSSESGCPSITQRHLDDVLDKLCVGAIDPNNLNREVGACFGQYGIPYKFGQYRHWQRGIMKMVGSASLRRFFVDEDSQPGSNPHGGDMDMYGLGDEEGEEEYQMNVFRASLVQAGHSVATAANTYAQSAQAHGFSIEDKAEKIELYRAASREWHRLLKLEVAGAAGNRVASGSARSTPQGDCRQVLKGLEEQIAQLVRSSVEKQSAEMAGALLRSIRSGLEVGGSSHSARRDVFEGSPP